MRGKNNNILGVITAYRVYQKKGTKFYNTSHWQLAKVITKSGVVGPEPCSKVLTDLAKLIKKK